jgi:protein-tyrosine phosphatase
MTEHPFDKLQLPDGGEFIFTPCPGTKETSLKDSLNTLKSVGAKAVITLLPNTELADLFVSELGDEVRALGIDWFQLPIEDDAEPSSLFEESWSKYRSALLTLFAEKQTLAIHCKGGSGRTGLMAAILMLESGYNWEEIKPLVQSIRPKALSHPAHLSFLAKQYGV